MRYFMIFLLLNVYSLGFEYHLKPYQITTGVECFFGLQGEAKRENGGRVLNTCYIESDGAYIIIDSGPTYSYAQQAYHVMQQKKALPIKYVINTSAKETHVLGNEFYKERGAVLIGPESYQQLLENRGKTDLSKTLTKDTFSNTRMIPLDIYQNRDTTINIGKSKIEIKKFEDRDGKHLVVYIPKQKIIFVGEYLSLINDQDISLRFEEIESLSWRYIISAHGTKRHRADLKNSIKNRRNQNVKKSLEHKKTDKDVVRYVFL